ncbi:multidrug-resistance type transporter aminotriazole resistance [Orobanche minor]
MIGKIILFMSRTTRPNCKQIGKEIDEQLSEQVAKCILPLGLGDDDQCIQYGSSAWKLLYTF